MSSLGVYFGPTTISFVENDGKKIINSSSIPMSSISMEGTEEKVPEAIKLSAALKEEFSRKNVQATEGSIVLLGRDLIIRTFHLPVLPPNELFNAVRFEAKKYIPFKVEELVIDFQIRYDKASKKNFVLFIGVKKEIVGKYLEAFKGLALKPTAMEYAGFSILRTLKSAAVPLKGVQALVGADIIDEDEVNFVVLENGFPLFSRDIILSGDSGFEPPRQRLNPAEALEKLKVELRISLDFYLRKFPTKNIESLFVISRDEHAEELTAFAKERGLQAKFLSISKVSEKQLSPSLSLLKAFSVSLSKSVKSTVSLDLFNSKVNERAARTISGSGLQLPFGSLLSQFKFNYRALLIALALVAVPYAVYFYRSRPLKLELTRIQSSRPAVTTLKNPNMSVEQLQSSLKNYSNKISSVTDLFKKRIFLTQCLDAVPRLLPEGAWLTQLTLNNEKSKLMMGFSGKVYLGDVDKEMTAVSLFLSNLKEHEFFSKHFKEIEILSVNQAREGSVTLTVFQIDCKNND